MIQVSFCSPEQHALVQVWHVHRHGLPGFEYTVVGTLVALLFVP